MRHTFVILVISIFISETAIAQDISALKKLIDSADSIFLVGHDQTDCVTMVDKDGNEIDPEKYKIAYQGKINSDVVQLMQRLPDNKRNEMANIITTKNHDKMMETCNCFIPFHSIVVYNQGKVSYMDICFACNTYAIGIGDSRIEDIYLGKKVMQELYDFFVKNKFPFNEMQY
jgi:hypothetical protein